MVSTFPLIEKCGKEARSARDEEFAASNLSDASWAPNGAL
jgi:hypothetical protein